ncbi:MAG: fasciclin domain-containing protein [Burkholderiales bacterium]
MHPFRTLKFAAAAAALVAGQAAHAAQDIVDTAIAAGQFTTLVTAVKAAGLVDTLKGPGPFTVFAPTDAAFAKLPPGTVDGLLKDPAKLRSVLTYHVVAGRVMAKDVRTGDVKTVQGQNVALKAEGGGVRINDATVVKADVAATNGVIHAIDTVILPK